MTDDGLVLSVLEIGPGNGMLTPELLNLGIEMHNIGEKHHVESIMNKYGHMGNLKCTAGWFPQDLPNMGQKYDLIFASRVVHCGNFKFTENMLKSILDCLKPGGKMVIETTSPWTAYYKLCWPDFLKDMVSENPKPFYELQGEYFESKGMPAWGVVLMTENQAIDVFKAIGADEVDV